MKLSTSETEYYYQYPVSDYKIKLVTQVTYTKKSIIAYYDIMNQEFIAVRTVKSKLMREMYE